jgi:peptidoglycan biosynthesis protein MviN/MurJ (putative lipid II flippase)
MHDGQNLFDPNTSAFGVAWMVQNTLDQLIAEGNINEIVVIAPYNTGQNRTNEYT